MCARVFGPLWRRGRKPSQAIDGEDSKGEVARERDGERDRETEQKEDCRGRDGVRDDGMDAGTEALGERKSAAKKRAVDGRRRSMHLSGGLAQGVFPWQPGVGGDDARGVRLTHW